MAKLAMLQLVQPVGGRSTTRGPINQEVASQTCFIKGLVFFQHFNNVFNVKC